MGNKQVHTVWKSVKRLTTDLWIYGSGTHLHFLYSRIRIRNHQKIPVKWLDTNPSYPLLGQNHHLKPSFLHLPPPPSPWISSTRAGYRPWNHIGSEIGALARSSVWRDRPRSRRMVVPPPCQNFRWGLAASLCWRANMAISGTKMAMETWKIHLVLIGKYICKVLFLHFHVGFLGR